jgi:hypothetical protein
MVGTKEDYSSSDQLRDLQRRIKGGRCDVIALAWRLKFLPGRQSLLLWDANDEVLVRVHVEGSGARWEKWGVANKARILADDPSDGFNLSPYTEGRGPKFVSQGMAGFVRKHSGGTFDSGLETQ